MARTVTVRASFFWLLPPGPLRSYQRLPLHLRSFTATTNASPRILSFFQKGACRSVSRENSRRSPDAAYDAEHLWCLTDSGYLDSTVMLCVCTYVDPLSLPDRRILSEPRPLLPCLPLSGTNRLVSSTWHPRGADTALRPLIPHSISLHSKAPSLDHRRRSRNQDNCSPAQNVASAK